MNYTELRTAVQDAFENSFSDADFATITKLAEQKIYNSVQLPALRRNASGTVSTGNKYLSCPTDFMSVFDFAVVDGSGAYSYLLNKDVSFIREAYPTPTSTGLPRFYALFGPDSSAANELTIILGPTPDADYDVELHYYFYPETIVTATNTWLSDNFDSVLFNGICVEAARILKSEQDMMQYYADQYKQSIALLKNLGDGKNRQDAYRSGQLRTQVI